MRKIEPWEVTERFWSRVSGNEPNECWNYVGSLNSDGYGNCRYEGRVEKAHRLAWMFTQGRIPKGMCVCHHCDNPACVNPQHLFLATHAENMADAATKGRMSGAPNQQGDGNNASKIRAAWVPFIRALIKRGVQQKEIAEVCNVSRAAICLIHKRVNWRHI